MAEAISLAFAATVAETLNLSNVNFLSDCQQLVHFLNAADQSNPPDWRIKPFTQMFSNYAKSRESKIFKISGLDNQTVYSNVLKLCKKQGIQDFQDQKATQHHCGCTASQYKFRIYLLL
jgi:hypothetical protein